MFRMTRVAFDKLLLLLTPHLDANANPKHPHTIPARLRLMLTLRWLAGGGIHDLTFWGNVGDSTFYSKTGVVWPTIAAIQACLPISFPIDDHARLESIADGFAAMVPGAADVCESMHGCVGALDGVIFECEMPNDESVAWPGQYKNRKGYPAIMALAGVDAWARFTLMDIRPGSTCDWSAWLHSPLYTDCIAEHELPDKYYLIGDEAFVTSFQLLSPWGGTGLASDKDSFNYHLSRQRQTVERAFGIMVQRWGILQRPLRCKLRNMPSVLTACAGLHNFCVDHGDKPPGMLAPEDRSYRDLGHEELGPYQMTWPRSADAGNFDNSNALRGTVNVRNRRAEITNGLARNKIRRPEKGPNGYIT